MSLIFGYNVSMSREIILQPSFRSQLSDVMEKLARRRACLDVRHIIIVPDRVTLTAETMLCEAIGGAFDVSVMTFNRLFTKYVTEKHDYLSRQGSIMVIKKLLEDNAASLTCFTKSAGKKGFSRKLYETISMLIGCNVPPEAAGRVRGKGRDLRLMYEKYLSETEGRLIDAGGRMKMLKSMLDGGGFIENAHVYICCFDNLTPQMRDILSVIDRRALSLTQYGLAPEKPVLGDVELYCAPGKVLIAKAAAARMARLLKNHKATPDDICAVTADGRADELKRILDENNIPYSAPEPMPLTRHPLGRLITSAITAAAKGYRPGDIVRLSKNPLSGVGKSDSDCFERYVEKYNVSYLRFFKPFENFKSASESGDDCRSRYEGAERARRQLEKLLKKPDGGLYETVETLIAHAEDNCPPELKEADEGRADPFAKARELSQMTRSLLDGAGFATAAEAFIEGMDAVDLAERPSVSGGVEIGDEGSFRARRFRYVFVLDFDYDNHPRMINDSALISDDEIMSLRGQDIEISPTAGEVNARQSQEFLQLISGADALFLGYSQKAGSYLGTLTAEASIKSLTVSSREREYAELYGSQSADALIYQCPTRSFMLEEYRAAQSLLKSGFDAPRYMPYLEKAVGGGADKFEPAEQGGAVNALGELALMPSMSASRIEAYAACPARHLFSYGLNAKPPETGEVLPVDIGNILHNAAESYIKLNVPEPDGVADEIFAACLVRYKEEKGIDCDEKYTGMLLKETKLLLAEIYRHLSAGSYTPLGAEMDFNYPCAFKAAGKDITLTGKIDRVDVSGRLCRVIDYKTGRAKFASGELYAGVKLQLMLYLGYMTDIKGYEPGGAYYFPISSDWEDDEITLDGVTESSDASVAAADADAIPRGSSTVINAKISRGKFTVKNGYTSDKIKTLTGYAYKISSQVLTEIAEGYASPSPYDVRICRYCDYFDCCGYDGEGRKLPRVKV